ncbi:MAG TPA: sugar phosphate isomerase/epimerase, partial [Firmicutes bacterium]|nr:sugar phosphate isomerase/epimerase [Bacillota bacterium]
MKKIGVQLYTLKEEMELDFFKTLEDVAAIGYEGVEFAGYYNKTATEIKEKLAQLNLSVAGSHIPYEALFTNLDAVIEFEKEIGNTVIVCPWATFETLEEWQAFFKKLNEVGKVVKDSGLQLAYHNHAHEFKSHSGKTVMEYLLESTDAELVKLELDTYWTEYAAIDTLEFMENYRDR